MSQHVATALFLAGAWLWTGCSLTDPNDGQYGGMVGFGFEVSAFEPCGSEEAWWISWNGEVTNDLFERSMQAAQSVDGGYVYARIEATVSGKGKYGHMGAYVREVVIEETLEVRGVETNECPG